MRPKAETSRLRPKAETSRLRPKAETSGLRPKWDLAQRWSGLAAFLIILR